jgi:hypothetical protein
MGSCKADAVVIPANRAILKPKKCAPQTKELVFNEQAELAKD